ncbi:LacI family DNA-binding transcriptional regulator [Pontivivens insulae]|uniref:HTH-type transcriptional regulator RafR n=1 Tax=Pontivivens insulae TaxID=1639689 RepID=A0A2R8AFT8_9RHOB|nr:substrate-binding domain-containing protein [Pontivivens insulae]RED10675.1 LacI family transcriptional regulator [Pontivivens insulae]SPF31113.1 HTH-type transcriptional regulator RafR [Pontivivens insulae]
MATLKEIGLELGLSPATVSRALNGFPEVSAKTRDRVREAAERLGYRANRNAQRLVSGRSGMVGMIVKTRADLRADQTFMEILMGLSAALADRDTDLVLAVDQGRDPVAAYRRMLERDMVDGFILNAPVMDDPRINFLREAGVPFVLHGRDRLDADYPFFTIDNYAVAAESVQLLAALGHKRIAFLNGPVLYSHAVRRRAGYLDAMARFGLPVAEGALTHDEPSEAAGYRQAVSLLAGQRGAPPTAFICSSTLLAEGVMRAAKDRRLSVPEDVSVMAHDDDLPLLRAISFTPALTVTRAPLREACIPVATALMDLIGGTDPAELQTLTRAELVVRDSTGPAPRNGDTPWP